MSLCFPLCLRSISRPVRIFLIRSTAVFIIAITFSRLVFGRSEKEMESMILGNIGNCLLRCSFRIRHGTVGECVRRAISAMRRICDNQFTQFFPSPRESLHHRSHVRANTHSETPRRNAHITERPIKWIIYVNMRVIVRHLWPNACWRTNMSKKHVHRLMIIFCSSSINIVWILIFPPRLSAAREKFIHENGFKAVLEKEV